MIDGLLTFRTEIGWIGILGDGDRIQRSVIGHTNHGEVTARFPGATRRLDEASAQSLVNVFRRFASGKPTSLSHLPIDESWMTPFQKQVTRACRNIPWGETLTYGQLASLVGSPRASRAVGSVMANNRFPLIIPCHRVCSHSGLGGFSAPDGIRFKQLLLQNEGAVLPGNRTALSHAV